MKAGVRDYNNMDSSIVFPLLLLLEYIRFMPRKINSGKVLPEFKQEESLKKVLLTNTKPCCLSYTSKTGLITKISKHACLLCSINSRGNPKKVLSQLSSNDVGSEADSSKTASNQLLDVWVPYVLPEGKRFIGTKSSVLETKGLKSTNIKKQSRTGCTRVQTRGEGILFDDISLDPLVFYGEGFWKNLMQKEFTDSSMVATHTFLGLQFKQSDGGQMNGSLMYLTLLRPDIMYAVCLCARISKTLPKVSHLHAVKMIFRTSGDNTIKITQENQYLEEELFS
ncbi:hypothetical protein Tco_0104179 [Tanacetum coccineum]